jgi:TetR/AcrR family transcriptional regulator, mexCD-oprJ operon repressor
VERASPTRNRADELRRRVAEENVEAILDATVALIEHDPKPSFVDIAREAGVSRPTLYAHFPTRENLASAIVRRAVDRTAQDAEAARLDDGPAPEALERLVSTAWRNLSTHRAIVHVALDLPAEVRRDAHESVLGPMRRLVERGQREGDFRDDQPREWMVSVIYSLLHGAAEDVGGGRLDEASAGELVYATIIAAFSPSPSG